MCETVCCSVSYCLSTTMDAGIHLWITYKEKIFPCSIGALPPVLIAVYVPFKCDCLNLRFHESILSSPTGQLMSCNLNEWWYPALQWVWGLIYYIFLGDSLFTHRVIARYIPNLRMCVKMYVVPQYLLFSTLRSVIVFHQEWMMACFSLLDIWKIFFHVDWVPILVFNFNLRFHNSF
jgi:hypothetical protein